MLLPPLLRQNWQNYQPRRHRLAVVSLWNATCIALLSPAARPSCDSFYGSIVSCVDALSFPLVAWIVVVPAITAEASPVLEMVATVLSLEDQVTELVTSRLLPSP